MSVYAKLQELDIVVPKPTGAAGLYVPVRQTGNTIYVSGTLPNVDGKPVHTGKLGADLTVEQGQEAARICAINMLSAIEHHTRDLNAVKAVVKINAFVASSNDFTEQPQVVNAASQLFLDVFGDAGVHARSAVGVNVLPFNVPVEIEGIFTLFGLHA